MTSSFLCGLLAASIANADEACQDPTNLLANPCFQDGLTSWTPNSGVISVEAVTTEGRTAAHMHVAPSEPPLWYLLYQDVPTTPGELYEARVVAKHRGIVGGVGAYLAVDFMNTSRTARVAYEQSGFVVDDDTWASLSLRAVIPEGAAYARCSLILNGTGDAWFSECSFWKLDDAPAPPPTTGTVTVNVTDEIVCDSLIGFGAEDDGWFYNAENAAHGADEDAYAIREERIRWLDPDWIRMFMWYLDWYPGAATGAPGYTFDSPNMQSHYRTLDLYESIGAKVNIVGVEWGFTQIPPDMGVFAQSIVDMIEHLTVTKGYTCVQQWTLTNEPNIHPYFSDYAKYRELHQRVAQELTHRALPIDIVASDDTNGGLPFFTQAVEDAQHHDRSALYVSHQYFGSEDPRMMAFFFSDHLDVLKTQIPLKPFGVAEFGFQDERTSGSHINPKMKDYDYAWLTVDFCIEGLNQGAAGFCIWCMNEVYYPGGALMTYGLWDFDPGAWTIRPVYHAMGMFMRLTESGQRVRACVSSHPHYFKAVRVGNVLFWVNRAERPLNVVVDGFWFNGVRVMTEATLSGERETGTVMKAGPGVPMTLPARSFGYAYTLNHVPSELWTQH